MTETTLSQLCLYLGTAGVFIVGLGMIGGILFRTTFKQFQNTQTHAPHKAPMRDRIWYGMVCAGTILFCAAVFIQAAIA